MKKKIKIIFEEPEGLIFKKYFESEKEIDQFMKKHSKLVIKKKVKIINICPKWISLFPNFEEIIKNGSKEQKEYVCCELKKLCESVDIFNEKIKNETELIEKKVEETKIFKVDENMIVYAFRYALGRQSYVVSEISDYIVENWLKLKEFTQLEIIHEIKTAIKRNEVGMKCDIRQWKKILRLKK